MKSTRSIFVLVSLITVILLLGSAFFQRAVFQAARSEAAVYLSPSSFEVKPEGSVRLSIYSDFSTPAFITAVQLAIEYDDSYLSFIDIEPTSDFDTEKLSVEDEKVYWAATVSAVRGTVDEVSGSVKIGEAVFQAKSEGATEISFLPDSVIISAIDSQGSSVFYNAATSVAGSKGSITASAVNESIGSKVSEEINSAEDESSSIKIVRSLPVALSEESLHVVGLSGLGRVAIDYGKTPNLGSFVGSSTAGKDQLIKIQNLEESTKYYYQVRVLSPEGEYIFSDTVKTFLTRKKAGSDGKVDTLDMATDSVVAAKKANVLAVAYDSKGGIVSPKDISFEVIAGEATAEKIIEGELSRVVVTSLITSKQRVVVAATIDGKDLGEASVDFDPNSSVQPAASDSSAYIDAKGKAVLYGIAVAIVLIGLVLTRRLRVK